MNLIAYSVGMVGVWIFADGLSSLWYYLPKPEEHFWRNHSFRLVRCGLGIYLIILGALFIVLNYD